MNRKILDVLTLIDTVEEDNKRAHLGHRKCDSIKATVSIN